ncbi:DUF4190 domain-containing protein [Protaetiibacter larvae]|nr:DUF4190 domain-containing protein [Protaetiibacter larvae]
MTETTSTPTAAPEQPAAPQNPYAGPAPTGATATSPTTTPGFSIAALVTGIASIPTGLAVGSIVAIVLGFVARSREPQGRLMANWGIALGFLGLFGWLVLAIIGFSIALPFLAFAPFWF